MASLGGLRLWLAKYLMDRIIKAIEVYYKKYMIQKEQTKKAEVENELYKERINDPNAKAEDIRDAGRDFIK